MCGGLRVFYRWHVRRGDGGFVVVPPSPLEF